MNHENETELIAFFENDDFDGWFLASMDREDEVTPETQLELFDACKYLAEAEQRRMLQTDEELREAIAAWALDWNNAD